VPPAWELRKLFPGRGDGIFGFTAVAATLDSGMGVLSAVFVPEFAATTGFAILGADDVAAAGWV
jgi:hypothetical protein